MYIFALLGAFLAALFTVFLASITVSAFGDKEKAKGAAIIWAVVILTAIIFKLIIGSW